MRIIQKNEIQSHRAHPKKKKKKDPMSQPIVNVLPHSALAAVNTGARIKLYLQGETGSLYELSTEDDRVYVCSEVVIPRKRLHGGDWVPRMFTPLAACAYDDGNEVSLFLFLFYFFYREWNKFFVWVEGRERS